MKKITLLMVLFTFCLVFQGVHAGEVRAAEVKALVDSVRVSLGESLNLRIVSDTKDPVADMSVIKGFKVLARGKSTSMSMDNFKTTREIVLSYTLIPMKKGILTIPAIPVTVDGNTYRTEAIDIRVSDDNDIPKAARDIFVEAYVSREKLYLGEQLVYNFKLFTAVQVSRPSLQKPDFSGFSVEELGEGRTFSKIISGREFSVHEVRYLLSPIKTGTIEIGPSVLQAGVVTETRRRSSNPLESMLEDPFSRNRRLVSKILQTEPLTIEVEPLPAYEGNLPFSGLVGKMTVEASMEAASVVAGDSVTMTITVSGAGNIRDAAMPEIAFPKSIKTYNDNPEETIKVGDSGYYGSKRFKIALVPVEKGDYSIGPVSLVYFDTTRQVYETVQTEKLELQVKTSAVPEKLDAFNTEEIKTDVAALPDKEEVKFSGRDILPLKEDPDGARSVRGISPFLFAALLVIPMLMCLGAFAFKKVSSRGDSLNMLMGKRAMESLKSAQAMGDDTLSHLYNALVFAVCAASGRQGGALTGEEVRKIMLGMGRPETEVDMCVRSLEMIEAARYSGSGAREENLKQLVQNVEKIVGGLL